MKRRSRPRPPARAVAASRRRGPWLSLDGPEGRSDQRWVAVSAWVVVAATLATLAWLAFRVHVIGDYFTESDFYGAYAEGARLVQHGRLDPSRNGIYGPLYEIVLGLLGFAIPDLFTAARLVSVLSATATVALTYWMLARRVRPAAGLWSAALLAVNGVFLRYGFSATTDALAVALQVGSIAALVADGRRSPWIAGMLAGLAALTRYSAAALVPAALAIYLWLERPEGLTRRRAALAYLGGFAVIVVPWLAFSLAHGHLPGGRLIANFSTFYTNPGASRNIQDVVVGEPASPIPVAHGATAVLLNIVDHLRLDLGTLLGWPVALLCALGVVLAWRDGLGRRLLPVWISGFALFAALTPVFYSDRYSLPCVPVYLSLAGVAIGSPRLALPAGGLPLKWLIGLVPVAFSLQTTRQILSAEFWQMPVEVLTAAPALRADAPPSARVLSRKGHIGYYSGLATVPFLRFRTLPELAAYCHARGVGYIFFSWYEADLRPEFVALLDTTDILPGLTVICATDLHPSVLYRVGPEFGTVPAWFANDTLRRVHEARGEVRALPDHKAWAGHMVLGIDALNRGDFEQARWRFERVTKIRPQEIDAWVDLGEVEMKLGHARAAADAFSHALGVDPANAAARARLGWIQMSQGDAARAAETWRPIVPMVRDARLLAQMLPAFEKSGDVATAARIRVALTSVR